MSTAETRRALVLVVDDEPLVASFPESTHGLVLDKPFRLEDLQRFVHRALGEDISLVTTLDPALGLVRADPSQIEQVIMNLVVNARDAMPQGGRLSIETTHVDLDATYVRRHPGASPGPHMTLAVGDTGVGMPSEVQAHIFEPLLHDQGAWQGDRARAGHRLWHCQAERGLHRGRHRSGAGTTFKIYLPRADEAFAPAMPKAAPAQGSHGTETILLVEDEEGVRDLARDILRAFLQKPFTPATLARKVRDVLDAPDPPPAGADVNP